MPPNKYPVFISANGAEISSRKKGKKLFLDYQERKGHYKVNMSIPQIASDLSNLPDRCLDLLELAGYVFCLDRILSRGSFDALEYQSWSRQIEFSIRVRDYAFWSNPEVAGTLRELLEWVSGDRRFIINFQDGHATPAFTLFDLAGIDPPKRDKPLTVSLFSGGLDSLTGVVETLESTDNDMILVSHKSSFQTAKTQKAIVSALIKKYENRIRHLQFRCTLSGKRAVDENQRTRSFLYTSIAYCAARAFLLNDFVVFENGITSMNLYRREDMMNARATRTTHPRTIYLMAKLFSLLSEQQFLISTPFFFRTKADVVSSAVVHCPELISSTVSCTKTFKLEGEAAKCGECFQCVDRRLAVFAGGFQEYDGVHLYDVDVITESPKDSISKTTVVDYLRQARNLSKWTADKFESEYALELGEALEFIQDCTDDMEAMDKIHSLCQKHGKNVEKAIIKAINEYDDIFEDMKIGSILQLIGTREYLVPDRKRLINSIIETVEISIPEMCAKVRPKDEPDLNVKVGAVLRAKEADIQSEHPVTSFACASCIPDHSWEKYKVLIESKYIRGSTSPSKASDGIAADQTKYPKSCSILFLVYDPEHAIHNDTQFKFDIERDGRSIVAILR